MNDYPIAANAETIRLITFSASNRGGGLDRGRCARSLLEPRMDRLPTRVRATDSGVYRSCAIMYHRRIYAASQLIITLAYEVLIRRPDLSFST